MPWLFLPLDQLKDNRTYGVNLKMTLEDLRRQLEAKFELVCFLDLAVLTSKHGSAFNIFKSLYQPVYQPNQRLVFYTSHRPTPLVIQHIQRAGSLIDISNHFILICTPADISTELDESKIRYGFDDTPISWLPADLEETLPLSTDEIYPYDTLCLMPFLNIDIDKNFATKPCCKYVDKTGHADREGIIGAMNNLAIKSLRREFAQGKIPKGCKVCKERELSGNSSLRQYSLHKYKDFEDRIGTDIVAPVSVQLMAGNVCNFRCRICDEEASSQIAAEKIKHTKDDTEKKRLIALLNQTQWNSRQLIDRLDPVLDTLDILHILGGEPMLYKGLPELLYHIIGRGFNHNIRLELHTNASIINPAVLSAMMHFTNFEVLLSIDDIGKRFELQRGGEWSSVDKNARIWASHRSSDHVVKIACTVNAQNIFYLDQIVQYAKDVGLDLVWWYLEKPEFLSIDALPLSAKMKILEKYESHEEAELRAIANRMRKFPATNGQKLINFIKHMDQRRNEDFPSSHPEAWNAITIDLD